MSLYNIASGIHAKSKEQNYWDRTDAVPECILTILRSIGNASEQFVRGNLTSVNVAAQLPQHVPWSDKADFLYSTEVKYKCNDELAAAYIALLDVASYLNLPFHLVRERREHAKEVQPDSFQVALMNFTAHISEVVREYECKNTLLIGAYLSHSIAYLEAICTKWSMDLGIHTEMKLAYQPFKTH